MWTLSRTRDKFMAVPRALPRSRGGRRARGVHRCSYFRREKLSVEGIEGILGCVPARSSPSLSRIPPPPPLLLLSARLDLLSSAWISQLDEEIVFRGLKRRNVETCGLERIGKSKILGDENCL